MKFDIEKLKGSVVDLGAKCKLKKAIFKEAQRAEKFDQDFREALGKMKERRFCSRYHNLAYAYARRRSYKKTENRVRKFNEPHAETIAEILLDFVPGELPVGQERIRFFDHLSLRVENWIEGKEEATSIAA